jgi:phosphoglycerate dehydrogenase-like enzyme
LCGVSGPRFSALKKIRGKEARLPANSLSSMHMDKPHIVVTYSVGDARRSQFKDLLGREARLSFLTDMPTGLREQTLIDADILLSWNLPKELLPAGPGLLRRVKMIQLLSAGADHLPFPELRSEIVIASNIGAYADPMAEHVLAMTLALAKNLLRQHQNMVRGEFHQSVMNRLLAGSVCGIIGFGGIGRATARLMRGLGLRIYAVNTSGRTDEPVEFIGTLNDLKHVLSSSDVVSISLPLMKSTRGLIGIREFGWMKPDAILINVARGAVIDEGALYEHLRSHPRFQAGLDVWWIEPFSSGEFKTTYPFFSLPNVLGSPHNSAMVPGINKEGTRRAADNVKRFLRGEPITGLVMREDYI